MATIIFGTWNIKDFSDFHINKPTSFRKPTKNGGFKQLQVKHILARMLIDELPSAVGLIEVTLGTGDQAVHLLKEAMNYQARKDQIEDEYWYIASASERNVESGETRARAADKYGILLNSYIFSSNFQHGFGETTEFFDRRPLWLGLNTVKGQAKQLDVILWHAPNPNNMARHKREEMMAMKGWIRAVRSKQGTNQMIVSGDFNLASTSPEFDRIVGEGFTSVFRGVNTMNHTGDFISSDLEPAFQKRQMDGEQITVEVLAEALLVNPYDNSFVAKGPILGKSRINVPFELSPLKNNPLNQNVDAMDEAMWAFLARATGRARGLSDHCPIFAKFKI